MTIRKTLLSILSLVFIAGIAQAQVAKVVLPDTVYYIPKTTVAPVIDGVIDDVWKVTDWNFQRTYVVDNDATPPDDRTDLTGMTKALWDDENLYVLFYNQDDDIQDNTTDAATYNKDAVEIYIDGDNSKVADNTGCDPGGGRCVDDFQITIPHVFEGNEADTLDGIGLDASIDPTGIEFKVTTKDEGGWAVELKIPIETCGIDPSEGTLIGFELQLDESDGDDAGARGSMEKWWSPSNNSWTDASIWGTAKLGPEIVVGVKPLPTPVPTKFALNQNYPNPFNPSTRITFSVANPDMVTLKVFSVLGKEVATLVNERMNTGTYEVDFNAADLPSGVYFYQITTGNNSVTKKMMLLK